MFRFENFEYLWALVAIPILVAFFVLTWYARKRAISKFGNESLIARMTPQFSRYKHIIKFILLMVGLAFLIVGWANPQWGTKKEKVTRKSSDVFIALDISESMLAEDVRPSRLDRARKFAQSLVKELKGERIGTIIFAGNAYLQMPLTTDYAAGELFLKSANPSMAPSQGTAISDAIDLAEQSFEEDNKHHKALVIITDGENHDQEAIQRAKEANDNGLLIFTVGVGTTEGGYIPINVGGRVDYKRDKTGNFVQTRLNPELVRDLAEAGNGASFSLIDDTENIVSQLRDRIDKIEKREFEQRSFSEFESYFQYFIGFALLLIIIEFLLSYRKSKFMKGKDIFKV